MTGSAATASDVLVFLAHALALEQAAARRYEELADSAAARNHPEVGALFRDLAYHSHRHASDVAAAGEAVGGIPAMAAWEFTWYASDPPEAAAPSNRLHLTDPHAALQVALQCEERALRYYRAIASDTNDPEVARLAKEFAEEEEEHVEIVFQSLGRYPTPTDLGWSAC